MSVNEVVAGRHTKRRLDRKHTHQRRYVIEAVGQGIAMNELLASVPPNVIIDTKILIIVDVSLEETDNPTHYFGEVSWATKDHPKTRRSADGGQPNETNDSEQQFSVGGGSQHIQEALTQAKFGDNAPAIGNSINVGNDGAVGGVDIVTPALTFSKTHYLPNEHVTDDWIRGLRKVVGRLNDAVFLGYKVGELLLLSANGSQRGAEDWQVTFEYSGGENLTDKTVAGITGVIKNAHDYLWVLYEQSEDATNKKMVPAAIGVFVATVYKSADFAGKLGV